MQTEEVIAMTDARLLGTCFFLLVVLAISWVSKKQAVVALSTSEAEYVALSFAAQEAAWLQKLFTDLQIPTKPIVINEDNQRVIALAQNPIALTLEPST